MAPGKANKILKNKTNKEVATAKESEMPKIEKK